MGNELNENAEGYVGYSLRLNITREGGVSFVDNSGAVFEVIDSESLLFMEKSSGHFFEMHAEDADVFSTYLNKAAQNSNERMRSVNVRLRELSNQSAEPAEESRPSFLNVEAQGRIVLDVLDGKTDCFDVPNIVIDEHDADHYHVDAPTRPRIAEVVQTGRAHHAAGVEARASLRGETHIVRLEDLKEVDGSDLVDDSIFEPMAIGGLSARLPLGKKVGRYAIPMLLAASGIAAVGLTRRCNEEAPRPPQELRPVLLHVE
ncbi:hypothetical protein KBD59_02950 [Candidatus Gracilibacteria bacterium]|nr:hypothetical protein [Candidatus Gracilibacteria bacterium]